MRIRQSALGFVLTAGVLSLAGCAAAPNPGAATPQASAYGDQICTVEKPIGSQIPRRICRSRARAEAEQQAASEILRRESKNTVPLVGGAAQ